jgi:hypothetical protein
MGREIDARTFSNRASAERSQALHAIVLASVCTRKSDSTINAQIGKSAFGAKRKTFAHSEPFRI